MTMKTKACCSVAIMSLLSAVLAQPGAGTGSTGSPYTVVDQGPNHKTWQCVTATTNSAGKTIFRNHRYTEIATGMSRLSGGRWVDASDQIQITATGAQPC